MWWLYTWGCPTRSQVFWFIYFIFLNFHLTKVNKIAFFIICLINSYSIFPQKKNLVYIQSFYSRRNRKTWKPTSPSFPLLVSIMLLLFFGSSRVIKLSCCTLWPFCGAFNPNCVSLALIELLFKYEYDRGPGAYTERIEIQG